MDYGHLRYCSHYTNFDIILILFTIKMKTMMWKYKEHFNRLAISKCFKQFESQSKPRFAISYMYDIRISCHTLNFDIYTLNVSIFSNVPCWSFHALSSYMGVLWSEPVKYKIDMSVTYILQYALCENPFHRNSNLALQV